MADGSLSMSGKVTMVTGASSGMGRVTAEALAREGATVVMAVRDPARGEWAAHEIRLATGNPAVSYLRADLSSIGDVRRLARMFKERFSRLDVLVNNAGAYFARREETVDGLEMTFALNHLSPFLLTNLLLEQLQTAAPARVITISSGAHRRARMNWNDLQSVLSYPQFGFAAYGQSKLANVLFAYELARRLEGAGITSNAAHPGFVATGFGLNNEGVVAGVIKLAERFHSRTPEEGARTADYLAISPEVEGLTGLYWTDLEPVRSSPASYDIGDAQRLWSISERLVGL